MSEMPNLPEGYHWWVTIKPGRTTPTEVTVSLKSRWDVTVAKADLRCGSFFNRPEDEDFFNGVVKDLAKRCLTDFEDPDRVFNLRAGWLKKLGVL